jgi:O-methyltransferase
MTNAAKDLLKKVLPRSILQAIYRFRSYSLVEGNLTYRQDGLYTTCNTDFLQEPKFVEAFAFGRRAGILNDSPINYRAYVACWAALKGRDLEGDFVECGVYRGAMSRMILHYVDFQNMPHKRFYLLDTYGGFPASSLTEEERRLRRPADFGNTLDDVQATFREFPNVVIVPGTVPETLAAVQGEKVCYLSLDMNAVAPEIAAAETFWPRMSSGAVIVLDDYGWPFHEPQKREFDAFAARRGVKVLPMPTGQGLIFKP